MGHQPRHLRRPQAAELTMNIRWCMGVAQLWIMASRVTKRRTKIRSQISSNWHDGEESFIDRDRRDMPVSCASESELLPSLLSHLRFLPSNLSHRGRSFGDSASAQGRIGPLTCSMGDAGVEYVVPGRGKGRSRRVRRATGRWLRSAGKGRHATFQVLPLKLSHSRSSVLSGCKSGMHRILPGQRLLFRLSAGGTGVVH